MNCHEQHGVVYGYTLNRIVSSVFIVIQVSFYHITSCFLVFESVCLLYLKFFSVERYISYPNSAL